ncbi:50S ribosomal protein L23 [Porphyromonas crevioricanis]|uniref:Large ribosomal subunit protein uL23 n=2 Tax=Porphyromonas crevioricanis TaxID=393921 RepID=A0A0A2FXL7_9PORP|nr:50S ribosomal protein L23 [Porphyromonas crevioricanis]KGN90152.1 50S ribosomal protein L23 [Porphyromonas crevioricanis]KGN94907.1 50S ribosomal protein L23 [Porphyromonas crevioricanis]SJZ81486.1 large subunit ribosomal protein L23 [Porphyromonas crevioricanis]SQH72548.1 50S ribosomal protein L23 [Porphyromonas crevioricanis]GAD05009.1 LSU ribosomal protein L23p [Porphyromonas crevioricanis JCM 15906]
MGIIIKPIISEKMTAITEKMPQRYAFRVSPTANKIEIAKAIEAMYNVKVESVNTMRYTGKSKNRYTRSGLIEGRAASFKKAVVTLKEGDVIDFFSNI